MKLITILLTTFIFAACGGGPNVIQNNPQGAPGKDGTNGIDGVNGTNGVNGHNSLLTTINATVTQCANGGTVILTGLDSNDDNTLTANEVTSSATVCNGTNGAQGIQGIQGPVSTFSVVSAITPCGKTSSPYKEVLLCLQSGDILASFSDNANGLNTRFAFITTGSFIDTDDSGCTFNVSATATNTIVSWGAGSNSFATWLAGSSTCKVN
jgi:hypothetical protein